MSMGDAAGLSSFAKKIANEKKKHPSIYTFF
jgi:hypothetical protein